MNSSWRARIAMVAGLALLLALLILPSVGLAVPPTGSISGVLLDHSNSQPLVNGIVSAYSVDNQGNQNWVEDAVADTNGAYKLDGLDFTDYTLYAWDMGNLYEPRWYKDTTDSSAATTLSITHPAPDAVVDTMTLRPWGHIAGHVTRKLTGENLSGIGVSAAMETAPGEWTFVDSATTDENGDYHMDFEAAGDYHVSFSDGLISYVDAAYQDVFSTQTIDPSAGTTVTVAEGASVGGIDQAMVDIDKYPFETDAPVTAATVDPDVARTAWSNASTATVSLDATDNGGSGVASVWYATDAAGPRNDYSSAIDVTAEGLTTVYFGAVDKWGNEEATKSVDVHLDRTAPDVVAGVVPKVGSTQVTLVAADPLSGVSAIMYSVDAGAETTYTGTITLGLGNHTVEYRAIDNAGNSSSIKSTNQDVKVAPILSTPKLSVKTPTHNKSFRITGSKSPIDPFASIVTLQIQSFYSGKWHGYKFVTASLAAGATNYSVKTSIRRKGSFRIRALHGPDWVHNSGNSSWRGFRVK